MSCETAKRNRCPLLRPRGSEPIRERKLRSVKFIDAGPPEITAAKSWLVNRSPLDIEIGCGAGLHPILWGKKHLDRHLLAIERTRTKFTKFRDRLGHHPDLQNIFALHADAAVALPLLFDGKPVAENIYILYPNPYPKSKHKNLRFAYSPLTPFLADLLLPGGALIVATNLLSYKQEMEDFVPKRTKLLLKGSRQIAASESPRTHFEKKYLTAGETCWNLVFRKPS